MTSVLAVFEAVAVVAFAFALGMIGAEVVRRYLRRFNISGYDLDSPLYRKRLHLWLGAGFAVIGAAASPSTPHAVVLVLLAPLFANLFVVDFHEHLLPNHVVWTSFALAVIGSLAGAGFGFDRLWAWRAFGPVIAGLLTSLFYLLVRLIPKTGVGFGDVKLALTTGTVLAWASPLAPIYGILVTYLLFGAYGITMMALKKVDRKGKADFGPSMIVATLLVTAWFGRPF